jgi:alcohol dehydrogenase class IV
MTFRFNTVRAIVSGPGTSTRLAEIVGPVLGARVLLVTDAGLRRIGLLDPALASLEAAGIRVAIFDGVAADPPEANIHAALAVAEAHAATGVLAIGGGSPMDVAKIVALLARSGEALPEIYGLDRAKGPRLPLALVPTTAGTGSEATPIAIVTTGEAEKKGVVSPLLLPDIAVLDADLTLGLPPAVTAATGLDAMVHAIEAYTSASPNNNPISRGLARQALTLLGAHIRQATFVGRDATAREGMLLGSLLAGQAFANAPVAAVHALAYPIGGHYHVPHGLSNALVLPHVLRFNREAALTAYAEIAPDPFPALAPLPASERAQGLIEGLAALSRELGLPQRLREVGIAAEALPRLARDAMKQTRLLVNNPRPLTEADILAIYTAAH